MYEGKVRTMYFVESVLAEARNEKENMGGSIQQVPNTQNRRCAVHRPWLIGQPAPNTGDESCRDVAGIKMGRGPCEPIPARALEDNHAEIRATADSRACSVLDPCFNSPAASALRLYVVCTV